MRKVIATSIAVASLMGAGKAGYEYSEARSKEEAVQARIEVGKATIKSAEVYEGLSQLRSIDVESLKDLPDNKLFDKAADIQHAVFAVSGALKVSDKQLLETLVSPEAVGIFEGHNIHFTFDPNDRVSEDCFNAWASTKPDGSIKEAFIPLSAEPLQPVY
jgi:hypothetical protein